MRRMAWLLFCLLALAMAPGRAAAQQFRPLGPSEPATGERYHVEVSGGFWSPSPSILVSSESLGILGDSIDGVKDLGMGTTSFKELRLVLRPATKHKFHLDYIPIHYEADTILTRSVVFNGQEYHVGLPVISTLNWRALHIGYEYDFLYRDRGFIGFVMQAKYSDVEVNLASPTTTEYAHARAPIPALGGVGRVYVVNNISITAEVTGFKLPQSVDTKNHSTGHFIDFDLYGTVNFVNNVGVQIGYRSIDVMYHIKNDEGTFNLGGLYFTGVARF